MLTLRGLMAVAPLGEDPAAAFARLADVRRDFLAAHPEADWLSAGMSARPRARDPGRRDTRARRLRGPRFEASRSSSVQNQEAAARPRGGRRSRKAGIMSGAMRRIGEYLGLLEDTGRYDDEYGDGTTTTATTAATPTRRARSSPSRAAARPRESRQATVADLGERRRPSGVDQRRVHGRRAVADHDAAPAHLQRGPHRRRELPRRHAGDHEPLRDGRRRRQASGRLRRRSRLRDPRHASSGSPARCSCSPRPTSRSPPRTRRGSSRAASSTRADRRWPDHACAGEPGAVGRPGMIVACTPSAGHPRRAVDLHRAAVDPLRRRLGAGVRALVDARRGSCSSCSRSSTPSPTRRSRRCVG